MSSILLGLGTLKIALDVVDLREYIRYSLTESTKSWRLVSVVSIRTFLFLGHLFQFYEFAARCCKWPLSTKLSLGIRVASLLLSFEALIRQTKESNPAPIKIFIALTSIASELCALFAITWHGRLQMSDQQLATMVRHKVLIKQEWINKTQTLTTYKLLDKARASELFSRAVICGICFQAVTIYFHGLEWLIKKLHSSQKIQN